MASKCSEARCPLETASNRVGDNGESDAGNKADDTVRPQRSPGTGPHHTRPDALNLLEQFGTTVTIGHSNEIYAQSDPTEFCWRVLSGCVRTVKLMEGGRRQGPVI